MLERAIFAYKLIDVGMIGMAIAAYCMTMYDIHKDFVPSMDKTFAAWRFYLFMIPGAFFVVNFFILIVYLFFWWLP
jgi:hypothetical protein